MKTFETEIKIIAPILKNSDVVFAGVFGSYARGEATEKSDLDLLIKFAKPKTLLNLVRLERELSSIFKKKVDLTTEGALSPHIKDAVLHDLKIIYGKR